MGPNKLNFKPNLTSTNSSGASDTAADDSSSNEGPNQRSGIDAFARRSSTADNLGNQPSLYERLFNGNAQGSPTPSAYQAPAVNSTPDNPYADADAGSLGLFDSGSKKVPVQNPYADADAGSLGLFDGGSKKVPVQNPYADADAGSLGLFDGGSKKVPVQNPYADADAGSLGLFDSGSKKVPVQNPYADADAGSLGISEVRNPVGPLVAQSDYSEADALYTLVTNWEAIGDSSGTTLNDLEEIAADDDAPQSWRNAAHYFIANSEEFAALDIAAKGGTPNGHVSAEDLIERSVEILPEEFMLQLLVRNFDELRVENPGRHTVSLGALDRINSQHPIDIRIAAEFYTSHAEEFAALDSISNGKTDDRVSIEDIRARQSQLGIVHNFQQVSSHNTFEVDGLEGLSEVYNDGAVRSFELDLHDNIDNNGIFPWGKQDLEAGEWDVRHFGVNDSEGSLNEYLTEINTLTKDSDEPISLFLDLKSALGSDGHNPADLDAVLRQQFGDRLFTPADFIASVPGATNLQEAIDLGGWPTEEQLEGRVFVVLTAKTLNEYNDAGGVEAAAFIAPKPVLEDGVFVPQDGAIFYNVNAGSGSDDVAAINQQIVDEGFLVRNYEVDQGNFEKMAASGATFLATDDHGELAAEL